MPDKPINVKAANASGPQSFSAILADLFKIYPKWVIKCGHCGLKFRKRLDPFIDNPTVVCSNCGVVNEVERLKAKFVLFGSF